jgi:hypothetical protein
MKLIGPGEQRASRETVKPKRKPTFNRPRDRYIILDCDHYTTAETQEAYSAWRTSPELYMCEVCGIEVKGRKSRTPPPQPAEPPF